MERALAHMQDKYVAVGKRLANWHLHNVGEWWMIWTEILGAAFDNEASILVPALVPARRPAAPGQAPAPADAETARRQAIGDSLALERQQIELLVGRITTQLLILRDTYRGDFDLQNAVVQKLAYVPAAERAAKAAAKAAVAAAAAAAEGARKAAVAAATAEAAGAPDAAAKRADATAAASASAAATAAAERAVRNVGHAIAGRQLEGESAASAAGALSLDASAKEPPRGLFLFFADALRAHTLRVDRELLDGPFAFVPEAGKIRMRIAVDERVQPIGQWWVPWISARYGEEAYLEILNDVPVCCAPTTQLTTHRYYRPQWRSRIAPLLPSIWTELSEEERAKWVHPPREVVISPTAKRPPYWFWCCFGYDVEDPQAASVCCGQFGVGPAGSAPVVGASGACCCASIPVYRTVPSFKKALRAAPPPPKPAPAPAPKPVEAPKPKPVEPPKPVPAPKPVEAPKPAPAPPVPQGHFMQVYVNPNGTVQLPAGLSPTGAAVAASPASAAGAAAPTGASTGAGAMPAPAKAAAPLDAAPSAAAPAPSPAAAPAAPAAGAASTDPKAADAAKPTPQ